MQVHALARAAHARLAQRPKLTRALRRASRRLDGQHRGLFHGGAGAAAQEFGIGNDDNRLGLLPRLLLRPALPPPRPLRLPACCTRKPESVRQSPTEVPAEVGQTCTCWLEIFSPYCDTTFSRSFRRARAARLTGKPCCERLSVYFFQLFNAFLRQSHLVW